MGVSLVSEERKVRVLVAFGVGVLNMFSSPRFFLTDLTFGVTFSGAGAGILL